MLTVVEIIHEAQQGITKPFLCRCDDGHEYFVKRANAGRKAQIAEWIAGSLARILALPVPAFALAEVPPQLLELRSSDERREWGNGPVFASQVVDHAVEIRFTDLPRIPLRLRAEILLFDMWIGNGDCILTDLGGNPNMLWSDLDQRLSIIDHNLAFESSPSEVRGGHAFAADICAWDLDFVRKMPHRLEAAVSNICDLWGMLPDIWVDESAGLITLESIRERLRLFTDPYDQNWIVR